MPSTFLPATAEDCFNTARMMLNDVNQQLWTDNVLMPMMKQAHLELQAKLKSRASPVMRAYQVISLPIFEVELIPPPIDLLMPIRIWEKPHNAPASAFQIMTETDMLPFAIPSSQLVYWMWDQDTVMFIGAAIPVDIFLDYWRRIPVPVSSTDEIDIIDGEQYLGPRIAALAAASVGEEATSSVAGALAEAQLQIVLSGNKSRAPQNIGTSSHP